MRTRRLGVLLPVSALPSSYGIGTLGLEARNFIDFLVKSGQNTWQVLPLVPTGYGDSPYASTCATAGSPYLIDIDDLIERGLLTKEESERYSCENGARVDYEALFYRRIPLLKVAFSKFNKNDSDFLHFVEEGEFSLFALFMAIKENSGWLAFSKWEDGLRLRDESALKRFEDEHQEDILFWQFTQYIFNAQWLEIKKYANDRGVSIMGDMPLYVSDDSVEVWSRPELFMLDENGRLKEVAGVPPDYFSETGQLWGNPLYNWEYMKSDGYQWWTNRLKKALSMYDFVRIDHFRGFDRFYSIPAGMQDARVGKWCDGPKEDLFKDKLDWNIVAEDLGILDDGVYRLMNNTKYPGMKILEFAFDGNVWHPYKPSNFGENCVVYTGTHDNATFVEFIEDMAAERRKIFFDDLRAECQKWGIELTRNCKLQATKAVVQLAYKSRADFVIIPLQDLLLTGKESRINTPGTLSSQNWSWRVSKELLSDSRAKIIAKLAKTATR